MNVLFLCSRNRLRSPTAETVFSGMPGVEVASAGTSPDAVHIVSADLIEWADLIFAMEAVHKRKLTANFRPFLRNKRVVVLGIPDNYAYMDESLVTLLQRKVTPHLRHQVEQTP